MSAEAQVRILTQGAAILGEVLEPAGFVFHPGIHASGSGGPFADGRFVRGDQYIELHFRHSLGLVSYGWGGEALTHEDYLRGLGAKGAYPGFSDDPLDGFRHLARDLAGPLAGFVAGDRTAFDAAAKVASQPRSRLP